MIIDDLNSTNNSGEFKTNYCALYPEELELGKENTDKDEATFLDLDFKIKDGEFHVNFFNKKFSFPFSIVRMSDRSGNISSNIVHSSIRAESLRIARASNNPDLFFLVIKPLISRMGSQRVSIDLVTQNETFFFPLQQLESGKDKSLAIELVTGSEVFYFSTSS